MPATQTPPAIDPQTDDLIPVRAIARQRLGRTISPCTVWRWLRRGARGVRLDAVQVCGVWHTTPEAFSRFIAGQTAVALGADAPATIQPRSPEKTAKLKAAGLLR